MSTVSVHSVYTFIVDEQFCGICNNITTNVAQENALNTDTVMYLKGGEYSVNISLFISANFNPLAPF